MFWILHAYQDHLSNLWSNSHSVIELFHKIFEEIFIQLIQSFVYPFYYPHILCNIIRLLFMIINISS